MISDGRPDEGRRWTVPVDMSSIATSLVEALSTREARAEPREISLRHFVALEQVEAISLHTRAVRQTMDCLPADLGESRR